MRWIAKPYQPAGQVLLMSSVTLSEYAAVPALLVSVLVIGLSGAALYAEASQRVADWSFEYWSKGSTNSLSPALKANQSALGFRRSHANYWAARGQLLRAAGLSMRDDPPAAWSRLAEAEAAFRFSAELQPSHPVHLLRIASIQADRFQFDSETEGLLYYAAALAPNDGAVQQSTLLLVFENWHLASAEVKELALRHLRDRARSASDLSYMLVLVQRYNMWEQACSIDAFAERARARCERVRSGG